MSLLTDEADLAECFDRNEFGEVMIWRGSQITVDFRNETIREPTDTDVEHIMPDPRVYVQSSLVAGMQRDETVSLRGADYQVKEIMPDGVGKTTLELIKA